MYVSARPLVEIQNLQEIFASTHLLTAEIVTHATIWRGEGGVQVLYPPHPLEKLKTIFHQAVSHTKKNEYDKAESITLGK